MCLCRIIVMSAVRLIAFWKKGVLPRDMGKEVLEGTNSLGSEKHICLMPYLVASRSPQILLCCSGLVLSGQDCPGVASKDQEALE